MIPSWFSPTSSSIVLLSPTSVIIPSACVLVFPWFPDEATTAIPLLFEILFIYLSKILDPSWAPKLVPIGIYITIGLLYWNDKLYKYFIAKSISTFLYLTASPFAKK